MGLFAVAHLAARHGITVTLSTPPDGGTTAEVYLPAALISLDATPGGWLRQAAAAPPAGNGERASDRTPAWDVPFSALRITARPEPPVAPEPPGAPEPGVRETVPLTLGAPLPRPEPESESESAAANQENGPAPGERVRSAEQPGQDR